MLPYQNKKNGVERIAAILEEENLDPERMIIDHNIEEMIGIALATKF